MNIVICTKLTENNISQRVIFQKKPFAFSILLAAINVKRFPPINADDADIFKEIVTSLVKGAGGKYV